MRIEHLRKEVTKGRVRVAADIVWEKRAAAPGTVYIETNAPFAADLEPAADGFLLAMLPTAQWEHEERVLIEGRVCSRLRDGLTAAMDKFHQRSPGREPLRIDATEGFAPTTPRREPRTASFLSGGIDALALLRRNRLDYPVEHAGYIRDCILLFGMNHYDFDETGTPRPERLAAFEANRKRMTSVTESIGATLIPLHTNIRCFYSEYEGWGTIGFGAELAGVAHCLSTRIDRVEIASGGAGVSHELVGSHPLLDHYFATEAVRVRHAHMQLNRFQKTRMVADWPEGLAVMRPCLYRSVPPDGGINCGKCEKCVRTMLTLLALGKLDATAAFPFDDITAEMIEPLLLEHDHQIAFHEQIVGALADAGRPDLVAAIGGKIGEFRNRERRKRISRLVRKAIPSRA